MSTTGLRVQLAVIDQLIQEEKHDEAVDRIARLIEALMKLREHLRRETHISGTVQTPTAD